MSHGRRAGVARRRSDFQHGRHVRHHRHRQGQLGAVVDGAVRDVDHSRDIGYAIWSRSVSPITGKWRVRTIAVNKPVTICGIRVNPGDLVLADETGVCFIPRDRANDVLQRAQRIATNEVVRQAKIKLRRAGFRSAAEAEIARGFSRRHLPPPPRAFASGGGGGRGGGKIFLDCTELRNAPTRPRIAMRYATTLPTACAGGG